MTKQAGMILKLVFVVIVMFGFGYALVPFYDVFCRVTGFGGKVDVIEETNISSDNKPAEERVVTVQFTAHANTQLPWDFKPLVKSIDVKVGEIYDAYFYVKNRAERAVVGQSTFNVTPPRAGFSFKKTECFCFTQQTLQAGEEQEMLVRFMLDPELPDDVHELTLSYTFFNTEKYVDK